MPSELSGEPSPEAYLRPHALAIPEDRRESVAGALLAKWVAQEVMVVMKQQIKALLVGVSAAFLSAGCYASAGTTTVAYAETTESPIEIDVVSYPHTYYEGRAVYFYQDRWYYRDGPRWVYYREEPQILYRQRGYVQQAPNAGYEREQQERARREHQGHEEQAQRERQEREQQDHAQQERQGREEQVERERRDHEEHARPAPPRRVDPQPPVPRPGPRRKAPR
jgi:hypothetical protein